MSTVVVYKLEYSFQKEKNQLDDLTHLYTIKSSSFIGYILRLTLTITVQNILKPFSFYQDVAGLNLKNSIKLSGFSIVPRSEMI